MVLVGTITYTNSTVTPASTLSTIVTDTFGHNAPITFNVDAWITPLIVGTIEIRPFTPTVGSTSTTATGPSTPPPTPGKSSSESTETTKPVTHSTVTTTPTNSSSADLTPTLGSSPTSALGNGTAPVQNVSSSSISNGAIAGIAIAMVVVGAALGFFLALCLLRRRYAQRPQPEYLAMQSTQPQTNVDDYDGSYATVKAATAAASDPSPISPTPTAATLAIQQDALQLSHFLLDAAPDKQLAAELSSLGHLIQQHVEDHYHSAPLQHIDISSLAAALVETGAFTINEASTPAQLAAEPRTRRAALQHVIAKVVLGSVGVGSIGQHGMGGRGLSMLPRSVGLLVAEMKPTERFRGNPEAMSLAFTRWRQLSAFLLSSERSSRGALRPSGPDVSQQAREVVHMLNGFLNSFLADTDHSSNSSSTAGKHRTKGQDAHLEEIVLECTKFGYTLFSQPAEFRLRFETGRNWNEIVVCPGLEKVSDDQGVRRSTKTLMGPMTDGI